MFDNIDKEKKESGRKVGDKKPEKINTSFIAGNVPPKENLTLERGVDLSKVDTLPSPQDGEHNEEFEKRMRELHQKGKKRGLKFSIIGLIGGAVITAGAIYLVNSYKGDVQEISNEINRQEREPIEAVIDPDNICNNDYCCLASLRRIKNNGYLRVAREEECPAGQTRDTLKCVNSLYWCESLPAIDIENESKSAPGINEWNLMEEIDRNIENESEPASNANEWNLMEEIDRDNDGLSEIEEEQYGTDVDNPDTDGDGYLDGDEVKKGYNPAGDGLL